ncbi:gastrula zinc finger protein XlCGF57.1-like [Centropristis striata]|uniref:gastrula zinc finger protein XlCGF57.1-like n=1 Tax=Centropristis striata TaxID=184440 RepID=UPI0027E05C4F|nr:gastrula zinc finger protein XlCGF57.1-like [Centropristis striata]
MSKVQTVRALVEQRLTAAAEEIFGLFERTIAEYEEQLCRSKEKNERQQRLLDAVFNPQIQLHRADIQQPSVSEEEFPSEQQERSCSLDQDQEEPEPPHIKEEQEEPRASQEGEQLQGLEEADITKFTFTPVPVKSEEDEEKPQSSQLHQTQTERMETEAGGEDCGGPGPDRNSDPEPHLQADTGDEPADSSEPETDDSGDWKETREPQSGLNCLKKDGGPVRDSSFRAGEKRFSCSECGKRFSNKSNMNRHMVSHAGEKPFSCSVCKKTFTRSGDLKVHMRLHTGEKPFSCAFCKKTFTQSGTLKAHMRLHTGERPFSCSVCKKTFTRSGHLKQHMRFHTGERPFSCSVCKKTFTLRGHLQAHMRLHTGERPFSCSICKKTFTLSGHLKAHMRLHTGERPFSCPVCKKAFTLKTFHKCAGRSSSKFHQTEENKEAEPPASSPHEEMQTEADGEDCGRPEAARNSDQDGPETDEKTGDSLEPETDDSGYWK